MDFSSGPGGSVSVYRFDDNPPGADSATLPHYWDIDSDFSDSSFLVSVTFDYDDSEVLAAGLTEEELKVGYYDTLWNPMNTDVDPDNNQVSVSTNHFSLFGIGSFTGSGIEEEAEIATLLSSFALSQNYPNPFNPMTNIEFVLPKSGPVSIEIFNILGQKVRMLVDQHMKAGYKLVDWDGKDDNGNDVSSGIYFYRLQAGDFCQTKKMVLLR